MSLQQKKLTGQGRSKVHNAAHACRYQRKSRKDINCQACIRLGQTLRRVPHIPLTASSYASSLFISLTVTVSILSAPYCLPK